MASTDTTAGRAPHWYVAVRGRVHDVAPTPGYRRLWLVAIVATLVLAVWFSLGLGGPVVTQTVSNVALILAAFTAAGACLTVGLNKRTGRDRIGARADRGRAALVGPRPDAPASTTSRSSARRCRSRRWPTSATSA